MRTQGGRLTVGVFVASTALLLLRFLLPTPVGLADNGDGWRLLCQLGGRDTSSTLEKFVHFVYLPSASCDSQYVTSQIWITSFVQWVGHLFGGTATLNLYVLGVLSCALVAFGVAMIVVGLRVSLRHRLVAAVVVLLVVADSAFFGYFASVLSEGAAFIGILLLVGGLLLMQRDDRWRYLGTGLAIVGGLLSVNAKTQTLVILPLLVVAVVLLRRPRQWLLVIVTVTGGTLVMQQDLSTVGAEYREINAYHTIFDGIVDGKHDTGADLAALGLPTSFSRFVGTTWWSPNTGRMDPEYARYQHLISRRTIVKYYLGHPGRTVQMLQQGAQDLLSARPANLNNFGRDAGEPAKEYRVPVVSGFTALVAPLGLFFLVPLWTFILLCGVRAWRSRREIAVVLLLLLGVAVSQFLLAALAEGIEGVKHQTIALFCSALAVAVWLPWKASQRTEAIARAWSLVKSPSRRMVTAPTSQINVVPDSLADSRSHWPLRSTYTTSCGEETQSARVPLTDTTSTSAAPANFSIAGPNEPSNSSTRADS